MSDKISLFGSVQDFETAQRMLNCLIKSDFLPDHFREGGLVSVRVPAVDKDNNLLKNSEGYQIYRYQEKILDKQAAMANVLVAFELSQKTGANLLSIMQALYIVNGKIGWSSSFRIAAINSSGKFRDPLNFEITGEGDDRGAVAYTVGHNGEKYQSERITIKRAKDEGWLNKKGSKWKTMPDQMLCYRAATSFQNLFAPEVLSGLPSREELEDSVPELITIQDEKTTINNTDIKKALLEEKEENTIDDILGKAEEVKEQQLEAQPELVFVGHQND